MKKTLKNFTVFCLAVVMLSAVTGSGYKKADAGKWSDPPPPLALLICLDVSSSMNWGTTTGGMAAPSGQRRIDYAKAAVEEMVESLYPADYIGVIAFWGNRLGLFEPEGVVQTVVPLTLLSTQTVRENVIDKIRGINTRAGTEYYEPIMLARDFIMDVDCDNKQIVFITDGMPNPDLETSSQRTAYMNAITGMAAASKPVQFNTVGLCSDDQFEIDMPLLQEMAMRGNGECISVPGNQLTNLSSILSAFVENIERVDLREQVSVFFFTAPEFMIEFKVFIGGLIAKPADPTREGYMFSGWFKDSGCTDEWNFSANITESINLYAKWLDVSVPAMVIFNDGATFLFANTDLFIGDKTSEVPLTNKQDGSVFAGWYKEEACINLWDFENDIIKTEVVWLYAKWQSAPDINDPEQPAVVNFYLNGVLHESINMFVGDLVPEIVFDLMPGYSFSGWYKDAGFKAKWNFAADVINGETVSIYGKTTKDADKETDSGKPDNPDCSDCSFASVSAGGAGGGGLLLMLGFTGLAVLLKLRAKKE